MAVTTGMNRESDNTNVKVACTKEFCLGKVFRELAIYLGSQQLYVLMLVFNTTAGFF